MRTALIALLLLWGLGCATSGPVSRAPLEARIDAAARHLMQREHVQGLAVAVIEDGKVAHIATFGQRNVERALPLTRDTVMYGASLTKTAFAYMLLQLVDEGRLDLDASIADLLPRPLPEYAEFTDLAGDERWRALTPRILLTHASGFANFRWLEPDGRLRFHRTPGARYAYSGEGFYILQLIVEQGLELDVAQEMQSRIFDRFGMKRTSMQWRADFASDLADGYRADGSLEAHDERSSASAAGSMDTTIADQARMWAGIVRGDGLSAASRAELVRGQLAIESARQFPTLAPADSSARNASVGLSAGLGVVAFKDTTGPAWFKGGHNDSTGNMVICLEASRRCAVMLANDVRAERLYPELARVILGDTRMPWYWEYDWADNAEDTVTASKP